MRKKLFFLAVIMLVASLSYSQTIYLSSFKITLLNPEPNLAIKSSPEKICLVLDSKIEDNFEVPKQSGLPKTKVSEWHKSLTNGFKNGFGEFFTIVDNPSDADLILKLSKADIEWLPAAQRTNVSGSGGNVSSTTSVSSVRSQVTFRAQLINNKDGEIIKQCASTAVSKKIAAKNKDINPNAASALESMYEIIADEFFEK